MSGATQGGWIHGKTVVDGEVQFLSVSSMQKAELCLRRWWYDYIGGYKDPPSKATERGTKCHAEVAKYLTTGSRAGLSSLVLSGMHMIPEPGDDLCVELDVLTRPEVQVEFSRANSRALLLNAPLKAAGIPITGAIDLLHARGTNKGVVNIEETLDPEGTVEVIDWKFPGKMDNAKAEHELIRTIQMSGYGKYVFNVMPDAKLVRLSHGYIPLKGRARKVTALHDRDEIERAWESTEVLAGSIRDAARETNPDLIDANTRSCRAFGRDCPAKGVCRAAEHDSLSEIVGIVAAREELGTTGEPDVMTNSIVAQLKARQAAQRQAASSDAPKKTLTLKKQEPKPDVKAEMQKLAREEAAAKFPGLMELFDEIRGLGVGSPKITGDMAKAMGALSDPFAEIAEVPGEGELAEYSFSTLEELQECKRQVIALLAEEGGEAPPEQDEAPPAEETAASAAIEETAAEAPKKTRTRKKKDQGGEAADAAAEKTSPNVVAPRTGGSEVAATAGTGAVNLYLNCVTNFPTTPLHPIVQEIMDILARQSEATHTLEDGTVIPTDVRLSDPNGKAGFGRWKAFLSTYIRNHDIPPGDYSYETYGEVGQEVAYAMQEVCARTGGKFVRGTR